MRTQTNCWFSFLFYQSTCYFCTLYIVYCLIGCLFEMQRATLLPYVYNVHRHILVSLYFVDTFFASKKALQVIMICRMCQIFCSLFFLEFAIKVAVRQSFTLFYHEIPFVRPTGHCLIFNHKKRKQFYDFDCHENGNGILNNCHWYQENEREI